MIFLTFLITTVIERMLSKGPISESNSFLLSYIYRLLFICNCNVGETGKVSDFSFLVLSHKTLLKNPFSFSPIRPPLLPSSSLVWYHLGTRRIMIFLSPHEEVQKKLKKNTVPKSIIQYSMLHKFFYK